MPRTKMAFEPNWRKTAKEQASKSNLPTPENADYGFQFQLPTRQESLALQKAQFWQPELKGRSINQEEGLYIQEFWEMRRLMLIWVLKEQSRILRPELRKIFTEPGYQAFLFHEPQGDIWNALYNMAYGVFDYLAIEESQCLLQYQSWPEWWRLIFWQDAQLAVDYFLEHRGESLIQHGVQCQGYIRKNLKNWTVPKEVPHHLRNLLEHAMQIAKHDPHDSPAVKRRRKQFREKYWQPYLKALRRSEISTKALQRSKKGLPSCIEVLDLKKDRRTGHIYHQPSRGRKFFAYSKQLKSI